MSHILLLAEMLDDRTEFEHALMTLDYGVTTLSLEAAMQEAEGLRLLQASLVLLVSGRQNGSLPEQIKELRHLLPEAPVIIVTASGNSQLALAAIAAGAYDFLYRPVSNERLLVSLRNASRNVKDVLQGSALQEAGFSEFVGRSDLMMYLLLKARAQAVSDRHLVICGERGVGKTMLAKAIHRYSPRCAERLQLYDTKQEAEIEHVLNEAEIGATLLFDLPEPGLYEEIGPSAARLFEEANRKNLRLIFCQRLSRRDTLSDATSPFSKMLGTDVLFLPALRHRPEDIRAQCDYFLARGAMLLKRTPLTPTPQAYRLLQEYDWPGNTRELIFVLSQANLLADGQRLTASQLEPMLQPGAPGDTVPLSREMAIRPFNDKGQLRKLEDIEAEFLAFAFHNYTGSRSEIARQLGIGRTTLYRKARQLNLV